MNSSSRLTSYLLEMLRSNIGPKASKMTTEMLYLCLFHSQDAANDYFNYFLVSSSFFFS